MSSPRMLEWNFGSVYYVCSVVFTCLSEGNGMTEALFGSEVSDIRVITSRKMKK